MTSAKFSDLTGKKLVCVDGLKAGSENARFTCDSGEVFEMYHDQDCCESVLIDDVSGDVADIIGSPVLLAEESTSNESLAGVKTDHGADSFTWTFYRLRTIKGSVTVRWYGESNGYYSESVSFERLEQWPSI